MLSGRPTVFLSCSEKYKTGMVDYDTAVPGSVPIDLVGRLARPATEDWYVSSPAMAATKVLVLAREDAYEILETLASSEDVTDRSAVVDALIDVARVSLVAVKRDLAERLTRDSDESIVDSAEVDAVYQQGTASVAIEPIRSLIDAATPPES
jgi:hypothetical protein